MFNIRKVALGRKANSLISFILFKFFQLTLLYREKRKDYGIEIFEYFYLPWKTDKEFNEYYKKIKKFTLNPKSRLYSVYKYSKIYLKENTSFMEIGTWKGGVCGLVGLANQQKNIEIFACDTFEGVVNASVKDSFFKNKEYNDTSKKDLENLSTLINHEIKIIEGVFPDSFSDIKIEKPLAMAHIDVDTYVSAKESFNFISKLMGKGGLIILDDYGGWFTDGVTKFGNELFTDEKYFVVPNHLGQILIFIK